MSAGKLSTINWNYSLTKQKHKKVNSACQNAFIQNCKC